MKIDLYMHFPDTESKIDQVISLLQQMIGMEKRMSKELDDLTTQVTANTTVEESAVTLIKGLAAQIAAAGTDPAKLQALQASLNTSATDLAAAVAANTPPAA